MLTRTLGVASSGHKDTSRAARILLEEGGNAFDAALGAMCAACVCEPMLASQPAVMGKALGIVYRTIATHLTRKAGYTKTTAQTGAVTLIQCFGGALNLNICQYRSKSPQKCRSKIPHFPVISGIKSVHLHFSWPATFLAGWNWCCYWWQAKIIRHQLGMLSQSVT